jgi:capsular polysaccharide biosynthesis protein
LHSNFSRDKLGLMKSLIYLKRFIFSALNRSIAYFVHRDWEFSARLAAIYGIVSKTYRQLMLSPVEWLDEKNAGIIKTLDSEEAAYSYGPKDIDGAQGIEQVQLPAVTLYHFENARVSVQSSSILLENSIVIERVKNVEVKRCNFYSGHVFMHGQKIALVCDLKIEHLKKGIFLGGNGSSNYYHWMIEILPKLNYLNELDKHGYEGFPLLVSEDVNHIKTYREALKYIAKDRPVVILNKDKVYCVGKLAYINAPNNLPFNLKKNERMRIADFLTRPASINFLQNRLSTSVDLSPPTNGCHRIFFARRNERRKYNQQQIFEIFRQQGFQKIFMDELSLKEQISLIYNAKVIAGPTGAEWTNLIFCRKGTKCLCWMAEGYGEFSAFSNLARTVGADLRYVTFKSNSKSIEGLYNKKYRIETKIVRKGLDTLLSATTQKHL